MESVAYVISLDAIDLNLLYNTYKPRHNITRLWSVNRKDLCEFQMHLRESSPEQRFVKNSESTKLHNKMENIVCHICNTYVPKQFLKEHNMSSKHNIYMKIAQTAVKRIRKRINDENYIKKIEQNESDYFCPHCVSVINIKEKKTHEGSLNHKNSVFLDKQLSEFLSVYSKDIEKSDNNNENNAAEIVHEGSNETIVSNETSISVDNSAVPPKNIALVSKTESNKTNVRTQLLGYVTSKYKYLFKIKMDNRLWCIVCDVAINETDSLETHTYLDDHIRKYVQLLIRNKIQIQYNNDFFCRLCNEVVLSNKELLHVNDSCHMQRLQVSENSKNQTSTSSYYCDVCNVNVPNRVHHIQIHNRGRNHLKNKTIKAKNIISVLEPLSDN